MSDSKSRFIDRINAFQGLAPPSVPANVMIYVKDKLGTNKTPTIRQLRHILTEGGFLEDHNIDVWRIINNQK